ncbi:MAG: hypothetical protein ABS36_11055 [Acidobacteria bacterium SCN 69-37]|nr:MAG: hypothetical protein ABS36_11055 [Acidobacteria bacterium SCN 69-37]
MRARSLPLLLVLALLGSACNPWVSPRMRAPFTPGPGPADPSIVVPVEPTPSEAPRRPTPEEVRAYRGLLGGQIDDAGRRIWTPALPGAPLEVRHAWLAQLAAAGATHVPIGPFDRGDVYPGVMWGNPDWTTDAAAIRQLVLDILDTPTRRGHGMVPVIFVDGGGRDPRPRLARVLPTIQAAIGDLQAFVIGVPCGWEPYEWSARECHDAAWDTHRLLPDLLLAWHGWVGRSNGASNPPQADDPFRNPTTGYGDWSLFWDARLSPFSMLLYQADPPRTQRDVECGGLRPGLPRWSSDALRTVRSGDGWVFAEDCWMNRASDAIARVGAGVCTDGFGHGPACGPGRKTFVFFEAATYHWWWDRMETADPSFFTQMASYAQSECRKYGVACGFGDGLPAEE